MTKHCLVVGGGFKGMIASYLLRKEGVEVTLLEKAPVIGGIMNSREWNGFSMDNGVQIFDSIPKNLGEIVREVLDDKVVPIDFNYASVYKGETTNGLAIPNLSNISKETQAQIILEMLESLTKEHPEAKSLYDYLEARYGKTAADLLDETMRHIYSISSKDVDAQATNQTLYHRLYFLPDDIALELKKHPELDGRIAARRKAVGKVDDFVSMYPQGTGMKGFCQAMQAKLEEMGVNITTATSLDDIVVEGDKANCTITRDGEAAESVTYDHVVWTNDYYQLANTWKKKDLGELIHKVPMVVYYFAIDPEICRDYTYFHKFTPGDYVFRPSAAGLYSEQRNEDGKTFISVECPGGPDSDIWGDPDAYAGKVWQECIDMGLLEEAPMSEDYTFVRAPVTHRFPMVGFAEEQAKLDADIEASNGVIIMPDCKAFVRRELMWAVEKSVEQVVAA